MLQHKTLVVDGRNVVITWRPKFQNTADLIIPFIEKHYLRSALPRFMPYLKIIITDRDIDGTSLSRNLVGFANEAYCDTIFFNTDYDFLKDMNIIGETIVHESTHLLTFLAEQARAVHSSTMQSAKLKFKLFPLFRNFRKIKNASKLWALLRMEQVNFLHQLQFEGVAEYSEYLARKKPMIFSLKLANEMYNKHGFALANALTERYIIIDHYIQKGDIVLCEEGYKEAFKELTYYIGAFMTYIIIFARLATLEELIQVTEFKFVRLYEKASKKIGFKPLVSLTDTSTLYCYNYVLRKMYSLIEPYIK